MQNFFPTFFGIKRVCWETFQREQSHQKAHRSIIDYHKYIRIAVCGYKWLSHLKLQLLYIPSFHFSRVRSKLNGFLILMAIINNVIMLCWKITSTGNQALLTKDSESKKPFDVSLTHSRIRNRNHFNSNFAISFNEFSVT